MYLNNVASHRFFFFYHSAILHLQVCWVQELWCWQWDGAGRRKGLGELHSGSAFPCLGIRTPQEPAAQPRGQIPST